MRKSLLAGLVLTCASTSAFAAAPELQNLSLPNLEKVIKTFAPLTNFRPLEPASAWAKYFGVSVGVVAQATPSKRLREVVPNSGDIPGLLPDANIVLAIQGPWGLGLEGGVFPTTDIRDLRLRQYAGNLKWTVNEVVGKEILPVDIAVRAGVSTALIGFKYSISGVTDNVEYTNTIWNTSVSVSRRFWFIEPYAGVGYSSADNKLSNEGRITLLGSEFTMRNNVEKTFKSVNANVGIQFHIWKFNITTQADYQFGTMNYAAKLAAKF